MSIFPPPVRAMPWSTTKARLRILVGGATVIGIAALLTVVTGFPFSHRLPTTGSGAASPAPTATHAPLLSVESHMTAISMVSPSEGWAAGYDGQDGPARLLHFHTGAWSAAALPQVPILPRALAMVSATNGWVGGAASNDGNNAAGVMLRYSGGQWAPFPLPVGAGAINSIAMVSASEGWAVDATPDGGHAHILRFANGVWSIAKTMPDHSLLQSVSFVSATEGWIAGRGSYNPGLAGTPGALWHYLNGVWQRVTPADRTHADVEYVAMLPSGEGWGIGSYQVAQSTPNQDYIPQAGVLWHYSGGRWQVIMPIIDTTGTAMATAVSVGDANDVWVGTIEAGVVRLLHCTNGGQGCGSEPTNGARVAGIAFDSPDDGWAVGDGAQFMHCFQQRCMLITP